METKKLKSKEKITSAYDLLMLQEDELRKRIEKMEQKNDERFKLVFAMLKKIVDSRKNK
jgi:hypothetical protein